MESDKEQEPPEDPSEGAGPSNRSQLDSNNESEETKQNKNRKFASRNYRFRITDDSDTENETEVPGKRSKSDSPRNDDTEMDVENLPITLPTIEMEANPERESSPDLNVGDGDVGEVVLSENEIDAVAPNLNSRFDCKNLLKE